jgi:copper transport protein
MTRCTKVTRGTDMNRRRWTLTLTGVLACLFGAGAWAHTSLLESVPAADARLEVVPETVQLRFSEPVMLTALSLRDANNDETRLAARESGRNATFNAELPTLPAGSYAIHWRVVSADTHVVSGEIEFSIAPAQ